MRETSVASCTSLPIAPPGEDHPVAAAVQRGEPATGLVAFRVRVPLAFFEGPAAFIASA
jgi:hypothetical protein